eukprot:4726174-Karenia_brevis.AAC.1
MYSLRHGGASEDLLRGRRRLQEVMRRGRWQSESSLRRYSKEGLLAQELAKVPASTLSYGVAVDASLESIFLRNGRLPPLPSHLQRA